MAELLVECGCPAENGSMQLGTVLQWNRSRKSSKGLKARLQGMEKKMIKKKNEVENSSSQ